MDFVSFFKKVNVNQTFEYLPDALVVTDLQGNILLSNEYARELLVIPSNKSNITSVLDINISIIDGLVENKVQSVFKVKNNEDIDVYVELSVNKIEDENKYVITARNVTQTHKFMKKMLVETESSKKVNRDKNSFLVKMKNELEAPLHSIDGFSKALLEGLGGELSEKQSKYLSIINKNAHDLLFLTENIIEQASLEAGLYEFNFKHLDVINLLQNVLRSNQSFIEEKNIEFAIDIDGLDKRTCFVDEMALKTVIQSLLDVSLNNTCFGAICIKLAHPTLEFVQSKEIEIPEIATDKSYLQFTISDSGNTLSSSEKVFIFDPYYQLEIGNKKNMAKSLTLSVAKSLIKNMRGKLWIDDESLQGTTFSFIIPNERMSV